MNKKLSYALLVMLGGALGGIPVIMPEPFAPLAWVALVPAVAVFMKLSRRVTAKLSSFFGLGFLFYFAYGLVCFHWFIAMYPLDFTGLSNVESVLVILLSWMGLSALYALLGAFLFLLFGVFSKLGTFLRTPALSVVILPMLFVLYEFTLTLDWWGVPWGRLALSQVTLLPILQTASLFGSYLVTALIVLVNAAIAYTLTSEGERRRMLVLSLSLLAFCINLILGYALYFVEPRLEEDAECFTFAALQGNNASQDPLTDEQTFATYEALTVQAADAGAEVVLWPESAFTRVFSEETPYGQQMSAIAKEKGIFIVVSASTRRDGNEYNSMVLIHPDGTFSDTVYDKRHLVPFGEYLPWPEFFGRFLPILGEITMLDFDNVAGEDAAIFHAEGIGALGGLICFDSIYEQLALDSVREGAELFIVGTNDSWFRNSLALSMHLAQEQLRSIEFGRYSVRASCTGITCTVNARGEVVGAMPVYEEGFVLGELPMLSHRTLYSYIGNVGIGVMTLSLVSMLVCAIVKHKKES